MTLAVVRKHSRAVVRTIALTVGISLVSACGTVPTGTPAASASRGFHEAVNLGPEINSQDFDGGPSISADGLTLYFVTDRDVVTGGDIWMATRQSTSERFVNPRTLGSPVNSGADEGAPSMSADGLELFFDRAPDGRIFVATRSSAATPFGIPQLVDLGRTECCDGFPDISRDGRDLYFCSDRPGGYGGNDVWVATRADRSVHLGAPVNLGPNVNGAANDCDPGIAKNGMTLYFASDRKAGRGGLDIWVAVRQSQSEGFGKPVNLGPAVNSGFSDERPAISADGTTLYFMSNRVGGSGSFDLWRAID